MKPIRIADAARAARTLKRLARKNAVGGALSWTSVVSGSPSLPRAARSALKSVFSQYRAGVARDPEYGDAEKAKLRASMDLAVLDGMLDEGIAGLRKIDHYKGTRTPPRPAATPDGVVTPDEVKAYHYTGGALQVAAQPIVRFLFDTNEPTGAQRAAALQREADGARLRYYSEAESRYHSVALPLPQGQTLTRDVFAARVDQEMEGVFPREERGDYTDRQDRPLPAGTPLGCLLGTSAQAWGFIDTERQNAADSEDAAGVAAWDRIEAQVRQLSEVKYFEIGPPGYNEGARAYGHGALGVCGRSADGALVLFYSSASY